jgi:hypothetical protein
LAGLRFNFVLMLKRHRHAKVLLASGGHENELVGTWGQFGHPKFPFTIGGRAEAGTVIC